MIIPERTSKVRSFRIPRIFYLSGGVLAASILILLSFFIYDYISILSQVYENKHLALENKKLKEQIQLFQMKINTITDDLERINILETKLRIITGAPLEDPTAVDSILGKIKDAGDSKGANFTCALGYNHKSKILVQKFSP
jgi:hypothetical protein